MLWKIVVRGFALDDDAEKIVEKIALEDKKKL